MKNVVLNEKEILDNALINGIVSEDYNDTVDVLIRHYLNIGYSKNEVYILIDEFLTKNMKEYRSSVQLQYLKLKIDFILKGGRFDLVNIEKIYITNNEWNTVLSIDNERAARVMFVLLVTVKLYMLKNKKNAPTMIINLKDILRESSVRVTDENIFLFNELTKKGLINTRMIKASGNKNKYKTMVEVNCIDINDDDVKTEINNFNNVVSYFYELNKGWKYKECSKCRKRFKLKVTNSRAKYCSICSKKIKVEQNSIIRKNVKT